MVYLFIIYIYVKLSSSLPKDILYTTNSTVHCMTHAPFVIVCTLPYIWTIKNKDKVLFFLNLIHRLSDQSICIETKRTFKHKVNINKFLKHFNILLYTYWKKNIKQTSYITLILCMMNIYAEVNENTSRSLTPECLFTTRPDLSRPIFS